MSKSTHNHINDESGDRKYFAQIPVFIWAMVRDPYDLVLWHTVKMIAWEKGVCKLSTEDLAVLSMMSVGKVSECRQRLIELGLIEGEVKKEADYPQPVWHLRIPDVWEENIAWAKAHSDINDKIIHKALQRNEKANERTAAKSLRQAKATPEEPSPHEEGTPPHEEGTPPHEEGTPPHEAIKIYIEKGNKKEDVGEIAATIIGDIGEQPTFTHPPRPLATPPRNRSRVTSAYYDPRKLIDGLIPAGKGASAVEVYFERYSPAAHKLTAPQQDDLARVVTDLEQWRTVVTAWDQAGNKPTNIGGMLDWYRDPSRLPSNRHKSTTYANGAAKPAATTDLTFKQFLLKQYHTDVAAAITRGTNKTEKDLRNEYEQWIAGLGRPTNANHPG